MVKQLAKYFTKLLASPLLAQLELLLLAFECYAMEIVVECDCLQVINLVNDMKSDGSSLLGIIVKEIASICSVLIQ